MTKRAVAALLLLLLAAPPLLDAVGVDAGSIRFAGLSLSWWYAGLLVPGLGAILAAALAPGASPGLLAAWLTPVSWLAMAAFIADRGPQGLWMALVLALAPLVALGARSREAAADAEPGVSVVALLLVVALLVGGCLSLAGGAAEALGFPRWQGVAATAAAAWLLTARPAVRMAPALLLVAVVALALPLGGIAARVGLGPVHAWSHVADLGAFRFSGPSPWTGREGAVGIPPAGITVAEEYRVNAPAGGAVTVRDAGGGSREWSLEPGQTITLLPGDHLDAESAARIRFQADARVPGSPPSGMAWAAGGPLALPGAAGWMVTALFGALGVLGVGAPANGSRGAAVALGAAAFAGLLWAQGWAVYWLAAAPDVFVGGVTAERLFALPAVLDGHPARPGLALALAGGLLASFLASSAALRSRLGALDRSAGGELGRDLGLWAGVFAVASLASLWPVDAWRLTRLALGAAACGLGPVALAGSASARARSAAGVTGLAVFAALTALAASPMRGSAVPEAVLADPALAAVPAALCARLVFRSARRR